MKTVVLFGLDGKVGRALHRALPEAGYGVIGHDLRQGMEDFTGAYAAIDFTAPEAVEHNVRTALEQDVPCIVGTTGFDLGPLGELARERGVALFHAPNFAIGAVLMMRFAVEAAAYLPRVEIVELHHEAKRDAPSGTAKATAALLPGDTPIHSVRLPGLVAHQEVLLGAESQLLTIRHDTMSREAFAPGVLLALERLPKLPAGLTVGLEALL
ncbi:MAG: 4-hydroxy-tetrahydrodipicolinate reductase [Gaiellaceae bacterium]